MVYPELPAWTLVLGLYGRQILLFLAFILGMIFFPTEGPLFYAWALSVFGFGWMIGWYGMELSWWYFWERK